jgi:ParB-like chromosome segregation protein Spo0J
LERVLLELETVEVGAVRPYPGNPRVPTKRSDAALERMVAKVGFMDPIVTNEELVVIAGEARLRVAKRLGYATVQVIRLRGLSAEDEKALRVAHNRIGELSKWSKEKLASELKDLLASEYEIELTGFEVIEIDQIWRRTGSGGSQRQLRVETGRSDRGA